jgi:hypothetical protein
MNSKLVLPLSWTFELVPNLGGSTFNGKFARVKFGIKRSEVSQPHFETSVRMRFALPKVGTWNPSGLPGLWELITPSSDLRLGRGLKKTCSSPQELSNGVLHYTCTHRGRVDSWLLVVGSQTASLTLGPSFDHNLCCICHNGSCEVIFDNYTSRPFQWYEEHLKARSFDPCNRALSKPGHFWDSTLGIPGKRTIWM